MADAVIAVGSVDTGKGHEVPALSGDIQSEQTQECNFQRRATTLSMILARDHARRVCIVEHADTEDYFVVHIAVAFEKEYSSQLINKANTGLLFKED